MPVIGVFCKEPEVVKKIEDTLFVILAQTGTNEFYQTCIYEYQQIEQLDFLYDTTDFLILDGSSVQESIQIAEAIWNITPSSAIIGIAKQLEDIFALLPYPFFHVIREFSLESDMRAVIRKIENTYIRTEKWSSFQSKGMIFRVRQKQILYFESQGHEILLHMQNESKQKEILSITETMTQLEKRFKNRGFVRIHKSILVNLDHILRMEREKILLDNQEQLYISRHRYTDVKLQFENFIRHLDFL